jgi:predicted LPLAT superfamily acyltransferase
MAEKLNHHPPHWAKIREAGVLAGMRFMISAYRLLGRTAFTVMLFPVMAYYYLRRRTARRSSMDFIRRAQRYFPERYGHRSARVLSFWQFIMFGQLLLDKYLAWAKTPEFPDMDIDRRDQFLQLIETRQGCLILGSHYGNLEYSRSVSTRHPDLVINVLIYDQHAAKFAKLMADSRAESRLNLIQVTDIGIPLALSLKEKVERGEWVVIAGDRVPVTEGHRVCAASFLGEPAPFPIGPYVLAALLKCPVFLLHCYHVNGRYRLELELFEQEIVLPRGDRQAAFENYARRYASALEALVEKDPTQWFNFFDFWGQ